MEQEIYEMLVEGFSIDFILEALNPDDDEELNELIWNTYDCILQMYE